MTDNVIEKIRQLIKTQIITSQNALKEIKRVYYGDPGVIAASNMPCICVIPVEDTTTRRGSRYDNLNGNITIKVVANIKTDLADIDGETVPWTKKVVQIMEKMTNKKFDEDTIMGIITSNPTLDGEVQVVNTGAIKYNFEGKRETATYEASLDLEFLAVFER